MKKNAGLALKANLQFLKKLGGKKTILLDKKMQELHDKEFTKISCLQCANCCKTISPGMNYSDVRRMSQSLKMKEKDFIVKYLLSDNEGEFVFKETPCPFLGNDNYCSIYDNRPKACREYPHTNRRRMHQIMELTAKNTTVCPAVFNIVNELKTTNF